VKRLLFQIVAAALFVLGVSAECFGQGIAIRILPDQAAPGSTVYLQATLLDGSMTNGCSFTASLDQATATGGAAPQFQGKPLPGPLGNGSLLDGAVQPDGSYSAAIAFGEPVTGPGVLFQVPIQIPAGAAPSSVYQLSLTDAAATVWVNGNLQPLPIFISSGLLMVTAPGNPAINLSVSDAVGYPGSAVTSALHLGNISNVGAIDLILKPDALDGSFRIGGSGAQRTDLTRNSLIGANQLADGSVHVVIADPNGLSGPGEALEIPLVISSKASPGRYAVTLIDVQASKTNGQPLAISQGDGSITVLPGRIGDATTLKFLFPEISLPVGTLWTLGMQSQDRLGNVVLDPPVAFSVSGKNSDAKLNGSTIRIRSAGGYLVQAQSGQASANAFIEGFVPPSDSQLFSSVVYGFPGDVVAVPLFFRPSALVADPVFQVKLPSDQTGGLPIMAGQPVLFSNDGEGVVYGQTTGQPGTYLVWSRGLTQSDTSGTTWMLSFQLPNVDPGKDNIRDYALQFSPYAPDGASKPAFAGGTGTLRLLSPLTSAVLQIASPQKDHAYSNLLPVSLNAPESSGGLLFAKAWIEGRENKAILLDKLNPSGSLSLRGVPEGAATFRVFSADHLGRTQDQSFPILIGKSTTTLGDLNGDAQVDIKDATLSLRITVGLLSPTDDQKAAGDANQDGKLNVQDTTLILRAAVGLVKLSD
jgi:hypothetical protein